VNRAELAVKVKLDLKVEISRIATIWTARKHTRDLLAALHCQAVLEIEHGLFPMCVRCIRTCGEANFLVASAKLNVEIGNKGVYIVVAFHLQVKLVAKGKIFDLHRGQIYFLDKTCVTRDLL